MAIGDRWQRKEPIEWDETSSNCSVRVPAHLPTLNRRPREPGSSAQRHTAKLGPPDFGSIAETTAISAKVVLWLV